MGERYAEQPKFVGLVQLRIRLCNSIDKGKGRAKFVLAGVGAGVRNCRRLGRRLRCWRPVNVPPQSEERICIRVDEGLYPLMCLEHGLELRDKRSLIL